MRLQLRKSLACSLLLFLAAASALLPSSELLHDSWGAFRRAVLTHHAVLTIRPGASVPSVIRSFCRTYSITVEECFHNISAYVNSDFPDLVAKDVHQYASSNSSAYAPIEHQQDIFISIDACLRAYFLVDGQQARILYDKHDDHTAVAEARCRAHQVSSSQLEQCATVLEQHLRQIAKSRIPESCKLVCRGAELRRAHTMLAEQLPLGPDSEGASAWDWAELKTSSVSCVDQFPHEAFAPCSCSYTNLYLRDGKWYFLTDEGTSPLVFGGSGSRCLHEHHYSSASSAPSWSAPFACHGAR